MKQSFDITGMSCAACSARVEKSVSAVDGVKSVSVNLLKNSMTAEFDENITDTQKIITAVENSGYGASLKTENNSKSTAQKQDSTELIMKKMRVRLIVSLVFTIPLFYISMGHMAGWYLPDFLLGENNIMAFAFTQFLLVLPVIFVNAKYYTNGFKSLLMGSPNMDSLIAIGSGAAVLYGIYAIYGIIYSIADGNMSQAHSFGMNLYFESAGMILTLITLGKYFETRAKRKTSDAISKLMDLSPKTATVVRNGKETEISASEIKVGDILIVKSGKAIPTDSVVIEGNGTVDESALTGESIPVEKTVGDTVIGAAICKSGYFKLRAEKVGTDTALSQIIRLVDEATSSKAPVEKLADKVSGIFVPIVITIAILAVIVWLLLGYSFEFALSIGISVLVISCPCALGLATPTAVMVGTGRGAANGILIKSAESLETAHGINTVVLDKTGTITKGEPSVTDIICLDGTDRKELLSAALSVERLSEHPLSRAIVQQAENENIEAFDITDFQQYVGCGVGGKSKSDVYYAGNRKLAEKHLSDLKYIDEYENTLADSGKTPLYFIKNNSLIGIIAVADVIKPTATGAIAELNRMNINTIMLTGDNAKTAAAIGKMVGITNIISDVLPQDKEKQIRLLQEQKQTVAMVGDGINDAPALARADVGIAIGAGTDVAMESADIVLMKSDLYDVVNAIRLSKAVMRNIKQNLFWAFFYNSIGIPVAAGVLYGLGILLNPMIAAAAMSFSSVCVVSNALRLRRFKPKKANTDYINTEETQTVNFEQRKDRTIMTKTVNIEGMMCMHCVNHVKTALEKIDGVVSADVSLENKCAVVTLSKDIDTEILNKAVIDAGYEVK